MIFLLDTNAFSDLMREHPTIEALSRLADDLEERGASVTAAEVATLLIESGLAQIQNEAPK